MPAPESPSPLSLGADATALNEPDQLQSKPPSAKLARSWAITWMVVVAVLILSAGVGLGLIVPRAPLSTSLPSELMLPATDEDRVAIVDRMGQTDPTSVRYIGTIDGHALYLTTDEGGYNLCLVTVTDAFTSIGCESVGDNWAEPARVFTVDEQLWIVVGSMSAVPTAARSALTDGEHIQLSPSVTAVRSRGD